MTQTKLEIIPELEFLLRMPICPQKRIAENGGYLNGFEKCGRCNGTPKHGEILGCGNYKIWREEK
ncbi:hypothetical protein HY449_02850 [Candidatus Pacearchaeota archaeon]|nr:hypothetical protein [Candidatus Pacearchaeota archaeon]